ncbi:transcriptional activator FtrB [Allocoprococcus comes]|nr:transcriptional activator FtrB [Coprococcus comes]
MQKEQDREAIYRSIFFCDMDRKKADEIINRLDGRTVTYDKGEIIIREREKLNNIGILLDGVLCKVQYYRDGTEQLVQKLVSSFVVGVEIAVSEKKTSPYDVYASEQAHIFWFPVRVMEEEGVLDLRERIEFYKKAVHFLANEDIRKYRKIELLSIRGIRERIEQYLRIQQSRHKSNAFDIEFNREQMANYLGINRSVLSHELKKMEKEGILKVRKNHFELADKE